MEAVKTLPHPPVSRRLCSFSASDFGSPSDTLQVKTNESLDIAGHEEEINNTFVGRNTGLNPDPLHVKENLD